MNQQVLSPAEGLIYVMVLVAAADRDLTDREVKRIGDQVTNLPVFRDFDVDQLTHVAEDCANSLNRDDGLDHVLNFVAATLPAKLRETAYALACEIAAADLHLEQEELRVLELLRNRLDLDPLVTAAIERTVRARHRTV